jgi:hypothetical protein
MANAVPAVEALLNAGADPNGAGWKGDGAGWTPLTWCARKGQIRRVLLALVPIRPRRRGERRSLRTLSPGSSLRPGSLAFEPRPRRLSTPFLTPFNSTPISSLVWNDP